MKKSAQRRHKYCTLALVRRAKKFRTAADHLPGGTGRPKFNELDMITTFSYRPSLVRIDVHNFELSW